MTASDSVPMWRLEILDREGNAVLTLTKLVDGPLCLQGDPAYLEDLVHTLSGIRFFRREAVPSTAKLNCKLPRQRHSSEVEFGAVVGSVLLRACCWLKTLGGTLPRAW